MPTITNKFGMVLALILTVSACGNGAPRLLRAGENNAGPDEFAILPAKPLQTPASFTDLPEPTPNATNITDPSPRANAIVALGGNPAVLTRTGIPVSDVTLLSQVQRFGVAPNIRADLSEADLAFRRRKGALFFTGWFNRNRYFSAYRGQSLNQQREFERLRAAGVLTPSAPPRTGR
jgi:hypothetical protein